MDQYKLKRWAERLSNLTVSPFTRRFNRSCHSSDWYNKGDYPEPSQSSQKHAPRPIEARVSIELPQEVQNLLQRVQSKDDSVDSVFNFLLSALIVLMSRLSGDDNIALGTNNGNGTPFVLRTAVDSKESFADLLNRVQNVWQWSYVIYKFYFWSFLDFLRICLRCCAYRSTIEKTESAETFQCWAL